MARHLHYNPGRDSIEYLEAITCGENRLYILDQLLISLRAEIGRPNHQHHLLIGPRGAGKTHLLRLLTAGRIPLEPALAAAYLPVVMPEETPLRSPGDLFLKFVDRLAEILREPSGDIPHDAARTARGICMTALTTAKGIRDPLERLDVMAAALDSVAITLGRIILPIAENMDQTFYLGAQRSRKGPLDEQWALRRHLQETPHIFLIAAAPSIFGAVGDPGKPFYDFFRTHELRELSNDEVLKIIRLRLEQESTNPSADGMRGERVRCILDHFDEKTPQLRGILAITGGLPRFTHLTYEVIVETDVNKILDTLNGFLDDLTPYFQHKLDPRVIPQAEIDLLHTLALARGPQQPSELAEELYGVQTNEISELLGRLQERGLVKRAGRPGGQAVTWDLTEPLYRVWTQFRDNPDSQDMYRLLGEFVALLFNMDEIEREREELSDKLSHLPDGHSEREILHSRKRLMDNAYEFCIASSKAAKISTAEPVPATNYTGNGGHDQAELNKLRHLYHTDPNNTKIREMLAKTLFNAIYDFGEAGDCQYYQELLEELRQLNHSHVDDAVVREHLAKALFNTIVDTQKTGDIVDSVALFEELRLLCQEFPDDDRLIEPLAKGLANAITYAGENESKAQIKELLEELRQLTCNHLEIAELREQLAIGLVNVIYNEGDASSVEQNWALLDELRRLSCAYPNDTQLREKFANGLVNLIYDTGEAGDHEQNQALLEELRLLCWTYTDDALLQKWLSRGLFNASSSARKAGDTKNSLAIMEELRLLSRKHSDDSEIREELARGLFNTLNDALKTGDNEQSRALLKELTLLSHTYPDEAPVRERMAKALFNTFNNALNAGASELSRSLLDELRLLSATHANDSQMREPLARGLFNALNDAQKTGDSEQSRTLLEELRLLSYTYPDDASVREHLAKGLFNASNEAGKADDNELVWVLLEELRKLSAAHTDDAPVRERLAKGIFNAFNNAQKANDSELSQSLLNELRLLYSTFPDDATVRERLVKIIVNALKDTEETGDSKQSQALLEEMFVMLSHLPDEAVEEAVQRAVIIYSDSMLILMRSGNPVSAREGMHWLESRMPSGMTELLRPMMLAMDVLEKGEEQALAREPEEVRRVVRMVLKRLTGGK